MEHLAPNLYNAGDKKMGACPIHGGDNTSSFNINVDPDSEWAGRWFCNTQHCHKEYPNDALGFILAMLKHDNPDANLIQVGEYLENFYDIINGEELATSTVNSYLTRNKPRELSYEITRKDVRDSLLIPSRYYINRGYSMAALDHFDVGLCVRCDAEMDGRVVFPIYDENDEYMVGCVGRDPDPNTQLRWKNSKGFNKANHLYNLGKARKIAEKTGIMVLVEGQGDVIRLWEAGVKNVVGMFGCSLSYRQAHLLCQSGVFNLVLLLDSDEAGVRAAEEINNNYSNLFTIRGVLLDGSKDVGEMTVEEIREKVVPQL